MRRCSLFLLCFQGGRTYATPHRNSCFIVADLLCNGHYLVSSTDDSWFRFLSLEFVFNTNMKYPLGVLAEARRRPSTRASWSTCLVVVSFDVYTPPMRRRRKCVDRGALVCSSALPPRRNFARLHSHRTVEGTSYCIPSTHTVFPSFVGRSRQDIRNPCFNMWIEENFGRLVYFTQNEKKKIKSERS